MGFKSIAKGIVESAVTLFCLTACSGTLTMIPDMESDDARLFILRCGVCHSLPHPKRHTYQQWINIVNLMNRQMDERGVATLNKEEKERILEYLKKNAR